MDLRWKHEGKSQSDLSEVPALPPQHRVSDILCPQRVPLHELVADAVLEGAVEARRATVGVEDLEAAQLVFPVHDQLCAVAVDTHQHHVLWVGLGVAAHELVGRAIGEELQHTGRWVLRPQEIRLALNCTMM